jgi:hypothetical protein
VSRDAGATWRPAQPRRPATGALRYEAPEDGRYDLYLVLVNDAGVTGPPPQAGTSPTLSVVVDSIAPLLQLRGAVVRERELTLDAVLVEEHLSPSGIRVFHRSDETQPWSDGGSARFDGVRVCWPLPANLAATTVDLHVVAADRAGNRGADQLLAVRLPAADADVVELAAAPLPALEPAPSPPVPPEPEPTREASAEARRLRGVGVELLARGQTMLALARLERAARLAPTDGDLLVPLGRALLAAGRTEDAVRRFTARLAAQPDDVDGLDGLAAAAFAARRYAEARAALLRLTHLQPTVGSHWLRLGDAEHCRGDLRAAMTSWTRAAELGPAERTAAQRRIDAARRTSPTTP